MHRQKILIIGEVFIDTHLDIIDENGPLVRLGGIFHSARAFSAMNIDYVLAYYAPDYLENDINYWACVLNTKGCFKLGTIINAPNVMLVNESKEVGDQGYYNIIKDQAEYKDIGNIEQIISITNPTDILIYPGRYSCELLFKSLNAFNGKVHIDFHYDSGHILKGIKTNVNTIILSTSSSHFKEQCNGTLKGIVEYFKPYDVNQFVVKENRGGSYCFDVGSQKAIEAPAYYVPTMHSVGVGDVYNAVFVSQILDDDIEKRMRLAALCAAKYAETMSFCKFAENTKLILDNIDELIDLQGIRLSWSERSQKNIYLAAPDFPNVDTKPLEKLYECLLYHNFRPHLPVRENGLADSFLRYEDELRLYNSDIQLLKSCDLLIAVLLYNDPGTLVELGMFKQSEKPTIVYDPFSCCENMFVKHTPDFLCKTIDDVISSTYQCLSRI
jgi:nucleoside 2-deoxyribosyltransferase